MRWRPRSQTPALATDFPSRLVAPTVPSGIELPIIYSSKAGNVCGAKRVKFLIAQVFTNRVESQ
jgi:hypothetical protein